MQVFILIMVMALLMHDAQRAPEAVPVVTGWLLPAIVLVPKLLLAFAYGAVCRLARRRLVQTRTLRWVARLDRIASMYRVAVLGLWVMDLYLGLLIALRNFIGDLVLLDELAAMIPTLALIVWAWTSYYPIDRLLREATLIRRIDSGQPVHPIWTLGQYLIAQLRHQVSLLLVPLLALLAWMETIYFLLPDGPGSYQVGLILAGTCVVFLLAPTAIRHMWDTAPLPAGELRKALTRMCTTYRVGVSELLLWRTFGGLINAAVMGIIGPLRYILLTDALLEALPLRQVEAVMAHELAHVRRHHMFWLLIVAAGSSALFQTVWGFAASMLIRFLPPSDTVPVIAGLSLDLLNNTEVIATVAAGGGIICWLLAFGWVSRRFERQADVFAVQHLARQVASNQSDGTVAQSPATVDQASIITMVTALQQVAVLNHTATTRQSWRHGSIAWRQNYLKGLLGQPVDRLQIDRQVLRIKLVSILLLEFMIGLAVFLPIWLKHLDVL